MIGLFVTQLALLVERHFSLRVEDIPTFLGMLITVVSVIIMMGMSFRNPELPNDQISPAYSSPNHNLRSPEDNLTLWQFMSVSWMSPLISLGSARQLNDKDVWGLCYEFQHKNLHHKFRGLKGSVIRRLLAANGLDLIFVASLGIISALSSKYISSLLPDAVRADLSVGISSPVLLQQILLAMESPEAPRSNAATYAAFALILRLIALQSSIMKQWYSRRSYERSRGEMITMIFQKTLTRKIIGAPKKSQTANQADVGVIDSPDESKNSKFRPCALWQSMRKQFEGLFPFKQLEKDVKEPASMGKILNLMR